MKFEIIPSEQTPEVPEIENIDNFILKNKNKINKFLEYVSTLENAAGLAANQTSLNNERFMLNIFAIKINNKWNIIIDPIIHSAYGTKETKYESCLTWEGRTLITERWSNIHVSYMNIKGNYKEKRISGFEAQVWQHEIDHLEGIEEKFIQTTSPRKVESIERNNICPCGSGKKYKKCCM